MAQEFPLLSTRNASPSSEGERPGKAAPATAPPLWQRLLCVPVALVVWCLETVEVGCAWAAKRLTDWVIAVLYGASHE